jgi:hypothetical protein
MISLMKGSCSLSCREDYPDFLFPKKSLLNNPSEEPVL